MPSPKQPYGASSQLCKAEDHGGLFYTVATTCCGGRSGKSWFFDWDSPTDAPPDAVVYRDIGPLHATGLGPLGPGLGPGPSACAGLGPSCGPRAIVSGPPRTNMGFGPACGPVGALSVPANHRLTGMVFPAPPRTVASGRRESGLAWGDPVRNAMLSNRSERSVLSLGGSEASPQRPSVTQSHWDSRARPLAGQPLPIPEMSSAPLTRSGSMPPPASSGTWLGTFFEARCMAPPPMQADHEGPPPMNWDTTEQQPGPLRMFSAPVRVNQPASAHMEPDLDVDFAPTETTSDAGGPRRVHFPAGIHAPEAKSKGGIMWNLLPPPSSAGRRIPSGFP
eukprot:TRINITY_DN20281_c0_g1_i1.p1 TRINITY_DN20281_c0_g1~~TRINITY_DN20281_c0_g1_i1.p1  ORF type:complete len:347 (+),score=46.95 TRINITY_DN20281_c0_g1_i1:38-1042(+)